MNSRSISSWSIAASSAFICSMVMRRSTPSKITVFFEDGDSDGAGVDPAAALSRRHALDAMTARLVIEAGEVVSLDDEGAVEDLVLSAIAAGHAGVGREQVAGEQL